MFLVFLCKSFGAQPNAPTMTVTNENLLSGYKRWPFHIQSPQTFSFSKHFWLYNSISWAADLYNRAWPLFLVPWNNIGFVILALNWCFYWSVPSVFLVFKGSNTCWFWHSFGVYARPVLPVDSIVNGPCNYIMQYLVDISRPLPMMGYLPHWCSRADIFITTWRIYGTLHPSGL